MKKHTVRSLSRRAAALVLALALALPTVYAHAGEQKLQTSIDLVAVSYTHLGLWTGPMPLAYSITGLPSSSAQRMTDR